MLVLRDIGQMREISERPDDSDRPVVGQAADDRLEFPTRAFVGITMETKRRLPDLLDDVEDFRTFLGEYRLAENAAEEPDIVAEREILLGRVALLPWLHRARGFSVPVRLRRSGDIGVVAQSGVASPDAGSRRRRSRSELTSAKRRVTALRRAAASASIGASRRTAPPNPSATIRPQSSGIASRGKSSATAK